MPRSPSLSASSDEGEDSTIPFHSLTVHFQNALHSPGSVESMAESLDNPTTPRPTQDPFLPSSGPIRSSPIVGNKDEKATHRKMKANKKQAATIAKKQQEQRELLKEQWKADLDEVLDLLRAKNRRFGDLMEYVFDPQYSQGHVRWHEYLVNAGSTTNVLNWWMLQKGSTVRQEVSTWAIEHVERVVASEAKATTESKVLQTLGKVIDKEFVLGFDFPKIHEELEENLAPNAIRILTAFSTSRKAHKHTARRKDRTKMVGNTHDL